MKNISFLHAVASAYVESGEDLSDYCFVFPNKRSGTFFLRELSRCVKTGPMLAPQVMAVGDFMQRISGRDVASRIELLFRLFSVYRDFKRGHVSTQSDASEQDGASGPNLMTDNDILEFDRFAPWGETVLSDFNEIDQHDAEAESLLRNVVDLREIQASFLSDDQLDALERFLGYRPSAADAEGFWKSVLPSGEQEVQDTTVLKDKFLELWTMLPELYESLRQNLELDKLATSGGAFRLAKDFVLEHGAQSLPWKRVVAVGFNMLSGSEMKLFSELASATAVDGRAYAEFFWDATGPVLSGPDMSHNVAATTLRRYRKLFPSPRWAEPYLQACSKSDMPANVTVAASPSNAAQVKVAAMKIREWLESIGPEKIADARVAVVVPDENLLLPLIHSLPPELKDVNLTMGFSMRYTSVASFVYLLRRMQSRPRGTADTPAFFHEDVKLFMSHPLVQVVIGTAAANRINGLVARTHRRVVSLKWMVAEAGVHGPELRNMLQPLDRSTPVEETVQYIHEVLETVDKALSRTEQTHTLNPKLERMLITHYRQALARLAGWAYDHDIMMHPANVFHLTDRLLAGETVNFEGMPLRGLQVMGLLETRALDFEHVMVLSMNDKVMPRRSSTRTFIPAALRRAYGLPGLDKGEELYSYYFYRLISRADNVHLIYDARTGEGMRSGGKSRFLMQLDMLYDKGNVKESSYYFDSEPTPSQPHEVEKTPAVMQKLMRFTAPEGGRNLSASAMMNYCRCQVLFYFKNVANIKDEVKAADYIDALTQGDIIHQVLQNLYMPYQLRGKYLKSRIILTHESLSAILADRPRLEREIVRAVNAQHFKLPKDKLDTPLEGSVAITAEYLLEAVIRVVSHDRDIAPIELVGAEIADNMRWKPGDAPDVNMHYAFDRVDVVDGRMRIVDYKTGRVDLEAPDGLAAVMGGENESGHYLIQLFTYAQLLKRQAPDCDRELAADARMLVYDVHEKPADIEVRPDIAGNMIDSAKEVEAEFSAAAERMLKEMFDPSVPFRPTANEDACRTCNLSYLCRGC